MPGDRGAWHPAGTGFLAVHLLQRAGQGLLVRLIVGWRGLATCVVRPDATGAVDHVPDPLEEVELNALHSIIADA